MTPDSIPTLSDKIQAARKTISLIKEQSFILANTVEKITGVNPLSGPTTDAYPELHNTPKPPCSVTSELDVLLVEISEANSKLARVIDAFFNTVI